MVTSLLLKDQALSQPVSLRPHSIRCQSSTSHVVQVEGTVDSEPHFQTVDSGAKRTFVSVNVMAAQDLPLAAQQLCGVTGHCTELWGPVEVE